MTNETIEKSNIEKPKKKKRKRIRRFIKKILIWFGKYIIAWMYCSYCYFVWKTSKITNEIGPLHQAIRQDTNKFAATLWHQDVFTVAWAYRDLHGATIASVGDAGEIITKMLQYCNFEVFRGGSSKGKSRRKKILQEFIEYFVQKERGGAGITVDGSSGPAYRMKTGAIVVAKETGCPLFAVRMWCKRRILFPTWDRTMFPLPFNHLLITCDGPYFVPENIDDPEVFKEFHKMLEKKLLDLTYKCFLRIDKKADPELMKMFPEDWEPGLTLEDLDEE